MNRVCVVVMKTSLPAHRDIASAIKEVLDAVNEVSKKHQGDPRMREFKKVSMSVCGDCPNARGPTLDAGLT